MKVGVKSWSVLTSLILCHERVLRMVHSKLFVITQDSNPRANANGNGRNSVRGTAETSISVALLPTALRCAAYCCCFSL